MTDTDSFAHAQDQDGAPRMDNYYALLNIWPKSSHEQIKEAYRRLAQVHHPDRVSQEEEVESTIMFSRLSQAYSVLSDPVSRALYDLAKGYTKETKDERRRINHLKRIEAERQVDLCEETVNMIREEEDSKSGLIVLEALYGDVVSTDQTLSKSSKYAGKCVDVTVPLQSSVKNSTLIVHGGGSKAWLEGFYDPNDDEVDNCLYVKYKFLDRMHQCIVADDEELCLPMKEHLIEEEEEEEKEEEDEEEGGGRTRRGSGGRSIGGKKRRSGPRMMSRAALEEEMKNIKASRRRNVMIGASVVALATSAFYLQKWNMIDIPRFLKANLPASAQPYIDTGMKYLSSILPSTSSSLSSSSSERKQQTSGGTSTAMAALFGTPKLQL